MNQTLSYCYLPDDFTGHRPANRELVERVGRGAVYSWPSTTTMHMDLMRRTRTTLDDAHNDGVLDAAVPAVKSQPDLANPEITEPIHHRSGCPHSRTGKCLCTYLAQWDTERTPAEESLLSQIGEGKPVALEASKERLADFTAQEEAAGRVISIDTLNGRISEWDGVFTPCDVEGNPMPVDTALLANTEQSLTFWKGQAKHWQKGYWIMAGAALLGWGTAVARGVWGF